MLLFLYEREVIVMYDRRKDMTKKAWQEMQKAKRATNDMNTGTRTMNTDKKPTRARQKEIDRKAVDNYE